MNIIVAFALRIYYSERKVIEIGNNKCEMAERKQSK